MTTARRAAHDLVTAAVFFAVTFALLLTAQASDGMPAPASESGLAAWWQTGALAAPVAALTFVLLVGLERLSLSRFPGLGFLRRGRIRAALSLSTGAVVVLLPNIADGSVTWGGLSIAVLSGFMALRPGGGEKRDEASGEIGP